MSVDVRDVRPAVSRLGTGLRPRAVRCHRCQVGLRATLLALPQSRHFNQLGLLLQIALSVLIAVTVYRGRRPGLGFAAAYWGSVALALLNVRLVDWSVLAFTLNVALLVLLLALWGVGGLSSSGRRWLAITFGSGIVLGCLLCLAVAAPLVDG